MMQRMIALWISAILVAGSPAIAGPKVIEYERMDTCPPFSVDGTQVFESAFLNGTCAGKRKVTLRIADYDLEALCSVAALACKPKSAFTREEAALYQKLATYRKTLPGAVRCVQRNESWRRDMITVEDAGCGLGYNAARSYDFVMKKGCVLLPNLVVGCIDLTDDQVARARGGEIANK